MLLKEYISLLIEQESDSKAIIIKNLKEIPNEVGGVLSSSGVPNELVDLFFNINPTFMSNPKYADWAMKQILFYVNTRILEYLLTDKQFFITYLKSENLRQLYSIFREYKDEKLIKFKTKSSWDDFINALTAGVFPDAIKYYDDIRFDVNKILNEIGDNPTVRKLSKIANIISSHNTPESAFLGKNINNLNLNDLITKSQNTQTSVEDLTKIVNEAETYRNNSFTNLSNIGQEADKLEQLFNSASLEYYKVLDGSINPDGSFSHGNYSLEKSEKTGLIDIVGNYDQPSVVNKKELEISARQKYLRFYLDYLKIILNVKKAFSVPSMFQPIMNKYANILIDYIGAREIKDNLQTNATKDLTTPVFWFEMHQDKEEYKKEIDNIALSLFVLSDLFGNSLKQVYNPESVRPLRLPDYEDMDEGLASRFMVVMDSRFIIPMASLLQRTLSDFVSLNEKLLSFGFKDTNPVEQTGNIMADFKKDMRQFVENLELKIRHHIG